MRQTSPDEIRFQMLRGLQQLPRSLLRDLGGSADKRDKALELAADMLMARFAEYEFVAPDPIPGHGEPPGRKWR